MDLFDLGFEEEPDDTPDNLPFEERLAIDKYNEDDCKDSIHGSRIPKSLGAMVHRLCTIRGIRHHYGFAHELRGLMPEFTRALNARDIMSGTIPTMSKPEEIPYCIWYPDIPTEDTLRALVQRYPDMLYHAVRTCAVAGYIDLYKELDPLPEVHVAEEAGYASMQRNNNSSYQIYQHILSQPLKYEIMNDYTCTVNIAGRRLASLNGDTAVYSSLAARIKYSHPEKHESHPRPWCESRNVQIQYYFNITEDWGICDHECKAPGAPEDYVPLVYSPLPVDLPLINKDKLVLSAAYNGEIDRYARLRRPRMIYDEWAMVVHGIHHYPIFAKYWMVQFPEYLTHIPNLPENKYKIRIARAIYARRIMSDDLSWVKPDIPGYLLPDLIWYPKLAHFTTYERLAHMKPGMLSMCLRAFVIANDPISWDGLLRSAPDIFNYTRGPNDPADAKLWWLFRHVDPGLLREAEYSPNKHFLEDILAAIPDIKKRFYHDTAYWRDYITGHSLYNNSRSPYVWVYDPIQPGANDMGPYDGMGCTIGDVDLALFVEDAISRETWEKEVGAGMPASLEEIWDLLEHKKILT